MRFMMIVKASKESEAGILPGPKTLEEMGKFNDSMIKAGVMLAGDGLQASSKGARVRYSGDKRTIVDGPFAETKELIAGFWIIQVKSKEEAIEWARRVPFVDGEVEVRQMFELEDFGDSGGLEKQHRASRDAARRSRRATRGCGIDRARITEAWPCVQTAGVDSPSAGMMRSEAVMASETLAAIEAVWRIEAPKLIAAARPPRPRCRRGRGPGAGRARGGARTVAGRRDSPESRSVADDSRQATGDRRVAPRERCSSASMRSSATSIEQRSSDGPNLDAAMDDDVGDDLLRLMFTACHPVLSTDARVALTLRLLGGLTTDEIARAYLVSEPTIAQRIVRAKRTLSKAQVPFEVPHGEESRGASRHRCSRSIYLIFNEGYAATAGDDWVRPALCEDALRLGRVLAELAPEEPDVHGLVALMEIQASRLRARIGAVG